MEEILRGFRVGEATWLQLSCLLIVAVYFRFSRVVSLRNLDLLILLAISPGTLLVHSGLASGYVWTFAVSGIVLARLVCDGYFTRRPRLEQNLNPQGLTFLCASAFVFLTAIAWTADRLPDSTVQTVEAADRLLKRQEAPAKVRRAADAPAADAKAGPAMTVLTAPFVPIPKVVATINPSPAIASTPHDYAASAARLASMVAHLAVVLALVFIGRWHFGDQQIGLAMGTLYLLLPCTSYDVGRVNHVLPAALILWAIAGYRRPLVAGGLMGLACGSLFFPVFLLPLWLLFYDRRGAVRFGIALIVVGAVLLGSVALTSADAISFREQVVHYIDSRALAFGDGDSGGFWQPGISAYRVPVFVAYCAATFVLSFWPRKKTLQDLITNATAIIVGTQFWYPQQGGVYSLWYLPLLLVVVFRPSLAHLPPPEFSEKAGAQKTNGNGAPRELVASGASPNGNSGTPFR
jgi:hypothetical protein